MSKPDSRKQNTSHLPGIVIPAYNDAKALQQNLPHFKKHFKELVIADNHSQDNCGEICQ